MLSFFFLFLFPISHSLNTPQVFATLPLAHMLHTLDFISIIYNSNNINDVNVVGFKAP